MRILHIWNQAGVSSILAIHQRKLGHQAKVIQQRKHDPAKISKYYGDTIMNNKISFLFKCITESFYHDIFHLHDAWFMVIPLRILHPKRKIVMHYHGSLVRDNTLGRLRYFLERFVDGIILATPDLLEFDYAKKLHYIPDPVDTQLFSPKQIPQNNKCFTSLKWEQKDSDLRTMLTQKNIQVNLETKERKKIINYVDFADKLKNYEFYADIPYIRGKIIKAHSMCGLQALSMGIKVINHSFEIESSLPDCHKPENVVKEIMKHYTVQTR